MKRPIMLWITSRSRSSMVSSMFIKHGVWWGNTPAKISGYEMNENQNIKKLEQKYKALCWKKIHLTPVSPNDGFSRELNNIVPSNETWMMKTGVEYFNAFKHLNPFNIFIYRDPNDVAKSLSDKRSDVVYEDALHTAKWRYRYMYSLQNEYGGIFVNTDEIINGDFASARAAFEYCGLQYNEELVRESII